MYIKLDALRVAEFLFLVFSVLFLAEISVGGSGFWSEKLIGFPLRKFFFVLISLFLILIFLLERKSLSVILCLSLVSVFFIVWGGVLPYLNDYWGSNFQDASSLFGLMMLCILSTIGSDRVLHSIVSVAFCFSFVLAAIHCVLYFGFAVGAIDTSWVNDFFYQNLARKGEIFIFTKEPSIRVFWASTSFILVGYTIALFGYLASRGFFRRLLVLVALSIFIFAAYASDTRALLGYMVFVPCFYIFFRAAAALLYPFSSGIKVALYIVGMILLELLVLLAVTPSILMLFGLNKEGEGSERADQIAAIYHTLSENIFWGIGLGGNSEYLIRSEQAPWSYEMSLWALVMKLGFIGSAVLLSILYLSLAIPQAGPPPSLERCRLVRFLCAAGYGYLIVVSTNPFLFSLIGFATVMVFYSWYVYAGRKNVGS
ncbi:MULTISPECIES: hypothetical protein [Pseudomonas aeruginosa group]|uniref:hypothetical protein n=1 Tax=Pseudomonas aeruginosa group TaxID=136841 RepID=UPI0009A39EEB|nr:MULTISPECIES: hypothetical protein [Pseudomonas aeruginosa group]MDK2351314.1 hypothetical protein [Pseudomonas paraeruginosa]MEA8483535.1 hypothetical protein [Pseudomonas aeruginosa]